MGPQPYADRQSCVYAELGNRSKILWRVMDGNSRKRDGGGLVHDTLVWKCIYKTCVYVNKFIFEEETDI